MSAIGGLLRHDGGVVDRDWLRRLGSLLARRGPDGELVAVAGPMGLLYRAYGSDPLDKAQSSLWHGREGVLLAFDGRLDNGPELACLLGLKYDVRTDDEILLQGFERFGLAFTGKIIGDFALAYWRPTTQQLMLARDPIGTRTLYFHRTSQSFAFATDLGSLLEAAHVDPILDEDHIAAFLRGRHDERTTIYQRITPVAPGYAVIVSSSGQISQSLTWSLPPEPAEIKYKDDRDYEEHFRQLFAEAVRVRLRTSHPVVAELSGGLDSSSVVCMADELLRAGAAEAPALITLSYVQDQSLSSDEGPYRTAVEDKCGREAFHLHESDVRPFTIPAHLNRLHVLSTLSISAEMEEAVCRRLGQLGSRLILTGDGGDEMFCSSSFPFSRLADLLVTGSLRQFYRELRMWSPAIRQPYAKVLANAVKVARRQDPNRKRDEFPTWIHPRMRERVAAVVHPNDRLIVDYRLPTLRQHARGYYNNARIIAIGMRQDFDARQRSFPCLHRPLVEFLLGVPYTQKVRLGENRSLQRRALRHILPASIMQRRGKGDATEFHERKFKRGAALVESLMADSWAEACGYINAAEVLRIAHTRIGGALDKQLPVRPLILELWLRAHYGATMGRYWNAEEVATLDRSVGRL